MAISQISLEEVFEYIDTDDNEQQIYCNIIKDLQNKAKNLLESLENNADAKTKEHYFTQLIKTSKSLESLVMLRKLYISGIISDPHKTV